jgi:hypothetical protein
MPCEIIEQEHGQITFKVSGKLRRNELARVEKTAIESMRSGEKVRFLVLVENFQGWENTDDWSDVSFQAEHDDQMEKIAIVGDRRWQELVEVFTGKGLRPIDIRYFSPDEAAIANAWIRQASREARS